MRLQLPRKILDPVVLEGMASEDRIENGEGVANLVDRLRRRDKQLSGAVRSGWR